jgi:hypothetical protein
MEITELMPGGATPFAVTSSLLLKFGANLIDKATGFAPTYQLSAVW